MNYNLENPQPQDTIWCWYAKLYAVSEKKRQEAWQRLLNAGLTPLWFPEGDVSRKLCKLLLENEGLFNQGAWQQFHSDVISYLGTLNRWQFTPALKELKIALKDVQTVYANTLLKEGGSTEANSPEHALAIATQTVSQLQTMTAGQVLITNAQATDSLLENIELWEQGDLSKVIIPFGFKTIDALTLGMRRGKLNIVAAPSGNGKSQFVRQVAYGAARRNYKVLVVSLEMDTDEVIMREASAQTEIDGNMILLNKATKSLLFKEAVRELGKLPISWITTGHITLETIQGIVSQLGDVDLIVVDYVKLLSSRDDNELKRMENLSRGLFLLASNHLNSNGTKPAILAVWDIAKTYMRDSLVLDMEAIAFGGHKDASLVITMTNKAYPAKHKNHPLHKELLREIQTRYDLPIVYTVDDMLDISMLTPQTVFFYVAKARNMGGNKLIPNMILDGKYHRFLEGSYSEWMAK